jgi:pyruvate dehydrogenase E1 component alpha subunit
MSARPEAFGMATAKVDGQDVRSVYAAAREAVGRAREGRGPTFLLCNTYRYHGHHVGDIARSYYRSKEEEQRWIAERDPIALLASSLVERGLADRAALEGIQNELADEMNKAVEFAVAAPYPSAAEVEEDVYA